MCTNEFIPKDIWRILGEGIVKEPNLTIAITPAPLKIIHYSVICTTVHIIPMFKFLVTFVIVRRVGSDLTSLGVYYC
jgi:hypothetical protein